MKEFEVHLIDDISSFKEIKKDWEKLYQADPASHLYISWLWFYGLFSSPGFNEKWIVLTVKNKGSSSYVAFLPLKYKTQHLFRIFKIRQLVYAGKPISAYSGFLCSPDYKSEAIPLIASYIQKNLKWDIINFDWNKDHRLPFFLNSFSNSKYSVKIRKSIPSLCITLPDDYQTYLQFYVGRETRRKIRRKTRFIQRNKRYKITNSTIETIERDINIICRLWLNHWHKNIETEWHRNVLHKYFENNLLKLSMIWDEDIPVSALACLIDPEKKIYNAYITSYNPDYSKIAPGIVLFAESIKQAIEQKYKYFDFTVGLDPYKLSFGPKQYETQDVGVIKKRMKTTSFLVLKKIKKRILKAAGMN